MELFLNRHDDVIKWKHFPRNWPFVRGIHRPRWSPPQRPVTRSFDVFFDLRLNKRLSKQPWGWWFGTPSWSIWRQCNGSGLQFWSRWGTRFVLNWWSWNQCRTHCVQHDLYITMSVFVILLIIAMVIQYSFRWFDQTPCTSTKTNVLSR